MGLLDVIFGKKMDEAEFMLDFDLLEQENRDVMLKRTAIEAVLGKVAQDVARQQIRVKNGNKDVKGDLLYRLNVMPNKNQSKHEFLYEIVMTMLKEGECLVVQTDSNDLLIADSFEREKKVAYSDVFRNVVVNDFEFDRLFYRDEVLYFKHSNESLERIMNSLYKDYGELLGRIIEYQLTKSQLRATVNIDTMFAKTKGASGRIQTFVDKLYSAFKKNPVAIIPQQKGLEYEEHTKATGNIESVDEVKKVKNQYLHEVARAVGYPIAFLNGDMADLDGITNNYNDYCLTPIIANIENELNRQLFTSDEYLNDNRIKVSRPTTRKVHDLLRSGAVTGNELREQVGLDRQEDELLDEFFMSKDYGEIVRGGDED